MNYSGIRCPVCEKEFQSEDDIVVCPECGAPHHRECYKKVGYCSMQELHKSGIAWENPNLKKSKTGSDEIFCPNCGKSNPISNDLCNNCRTPLDPKNATDFNKNTENQQPQTSKDIESHMGMEIGNFNHDKYIDYLFKDNSDNDLIGDIPTKEFAYYTQRNYIYFIRVFKLICQRTKTFIFNWSACLFTYVYFFYRKMFKMGIVIMALIFVSYIPSLIINIDATQQFISSIDFNQIVATADIGTLTNKYVNFIPDLSGLENLQTASVVFFQIRLIIHLFCGFVANGKYYQQAVADIKKVKSSLPKEIAAPDVYPFIVKKGGTSFLMVLLLLLIQYLAPVALMTIIFPPQ